MKVTLLNTTIATTDGTYEVSTISREEAFKICAEADELQSAIGHESTAQALTNLLCQNVEMNRMNFKHSLDDVVVCFKLNGRPPEGAILSLQEIEKIGYEFKLMIKRGE